MIIRRAGCTLAALALFVMVLLFMVQLLGIILVLKDLKRALGLHYLLYISVLVSAGSFGTWGRSPAAPYVENNGKRDWGRIDNGNGYPFGCFHALGFANPNTQRPSLGELTLSRHQGL